MTDDATRQNQLARKVIRGLLDEGDPNGTRAEDCGPWAETVTELYNAHAEGGTNQVKSTFNALGKADPALVRLVASKPAPVKTRWTAAELLSTDFPEPRWAVPDVIPVGLSFLAGRPKLGKSWLALQVAHAVGTGGKALDRDVEKGKVLFLALEDSPRRLKGRMKIQGVPSTAAITFETSWNGFTEGGLVDLQAEIERDGYTLIVIDTLSRALGRADQSDLAEMTVILGNLQHLAQVYDLAILLIDHHRKPSGMITNPIDDILGTTAKAAVADAALGLFREQGKHGASLKVTGRDLEEQELALEWDNQLCCWQLLGDAGTVRKDTLKADILTAIQDLEEMGEIPATTRIAQHLSKDKGNVSRILAELVQAGQVVKGKKEGRLVPYRLPDQEED